ncbi:hypothetical protein P3T76_015321 [Phytophthora citrophthora]|uniref:Uncharacterized protein n=1 Tax=Phytophthora citrophthora TaxID=4793 RepID=A0AAD9FZL5_9STRA|nr:hypothetical protein P3T76_015321 [Phytophthora citrophthora]
MEWPVHRFNSSNVWVWFKFKKLRNVHNVERGDIERYLSTIREDLEHVQARTHDGLNEHEVVSISKLFVRDVAP